MNYQQLQDILRQNRVGGVMQAPKAIGLQDVISGIQSQYTQPQSSFQSIPAMVQQMQAQQPSGAGRFVNPSQTFGQQAFTPVSQEPSSFIPGKLILPSAPTVNDLINTISNNDGGGYGGDSAPSGTGIDGTGLTQSANVSPGMVGGLATLGGLVTGTPLGLAANVIGKGDIADAINAQAHAANVANNMAVIGAQMGLDPSDPANLGAIASGIDAALSGKADGPTATSGPSGTGASAAAAGQAAANAAAAAGYSPSAIGQAQQTAVNASLMGMTEAQAVNAAMMGAPTAADAQAIADSFGAGLLGGFDAGSISAANSAGMGESGGYSGGFSEGGFGEGQY